MQGYIPNANTRRLMVSVPVTNVGNKTISFTENEELTQHAARIVSIQSFHAGQVAKDLDGKTVVPQAVHDVAYLQLKDSSTEIATVPLKNLSLQTPATEIPLLLLNKFNVQQSKVAIADTAGLVLDNVFLFLVTYEKKQ